eukprot:Gb_29488 [translate_table: standard]
MVGYALSAGTQKPAWLEALLTDKFFVACSTHLESRKNETNIFCVDCSISICQHCLPRHRSHRLLQVRRYVYHDVIRLQDMQKLFECSHVQTYIINSARVVFLNQRPQSRPAKGLANSCENCERSLQESYRYCSVACKVDAVLNQGKNLSALLQSCKSLPFPDIFAYSIGSPKAGKVGIEEEFSPKSILEQLSSAPSGSSTASSDSELDVFTSSSLPKKIRSCNRPCVLALSPKSVICPPKRRRKGVPHRSPIC